MEYNIVVAGAGPAAKATFGSGNCIKIGHCHIFHSLSTVGLDNGCPQHTMYLAGPGCFAFQLWILRKEE